MQKIAEDGDKKAKYFIPIFLWKRPCEKDKIVKRGHLHKLKGIFFIGWPKICEGHIYIV